MIRNICNPHFVFSFFFLVILPSTFPRGALSIPNLKQIAVTTLPTKKQRQVRGHYQHISQEGNLFFFAIAHHGSFYNLFRSHFMPSSSSPALPKAHFPTLKDEVQRQATQVISITENKICVFMCLCVCVCLCVSVCECVCVREWERGREREREIEREEINKINIFEYTFLLKVSHNRMDPIKSRWIPPR